RAERAVSEIAKSDEVETHRGGSHLSTRVATPSRWWKVLRHDARQMTQDEPSPYSCPGQPAATSYSSQSWMVCSASIASLCARSAAKHACTCSVIACPMSRSC